MYLYMPKKEFSPAYDFIFKRFRNNVCGICSRLETCILRSNNLDERTRILGDCYHKYCVNCQIELV